ncbi:MAG: S46 family peptidase [Bacteroidales bacterium]|nr:S46 family peptidase [Bacteroidales bacterium]
MKKLFLLPIFALLMAQVCATNPPDEGMWLPMFVKDYNYATMKHLGLHLTAEQMWDINNSSIKDAIVELGEDGDHFCTGEIISENGLMLTNHHCGYASIADHSTTDHDYLKDGFWAASYKDELPNQHITATFLVRMEDVTAKVLKGVTEENRDDQIETAIKELTNEAEENGRYTAVIKDFYDGNQYFMFIYEVYKDVRLVGAPPSSIGKFGDETDNWVWPRHTGDFSMFRIYTAPDGSPAEYSENNVPMKPKYSLPISMKGIEDGDFAMVWGIPGSTSRYLTSYEINLQLETTDKPIIEFCDAVLPVIRAEMNARDEVRIMYASDYASWANTWKNQKGELSSLTDLGIADKKAEQEKDLLKWINASKARKDKYGNPVDSIKAICESVDVTSFRYLYYANFSMRLSKLLSTAISLDVDLPDGQKKFSDEQKASIMEAYRESMKNSDAKTEEKIIAAELKLWMSLPLEDQPSFCTVIREKFHGDCDAYAHAAMQKSVIASEAAFQKYLDKPSMKVFMNDPIVKIAIGVYQQLYFNIFAYYYYDGAITEARRNFMAAMLEKNADSPMYPDANSTMRCTYGTVCDYSPRDGVRYSYYTTADGILQKEIPGDPEFDVNPKLKKLILDKDFGPYAMKDGKLPVCFLTNNDITGGNSGSPVINGNGELIGCAFDGNIEALCSDIYFDTELQRCICVDIRYVLFVIDKFAGAQRFINEMNIVK